MKKKIIVVAIVAVILSLAVIVGYLYWHQKYSVGRVAKNIMNEIDHSVDSNGECTIDLSMLTDFEWDIVVAVAEEATVTDDYSDKEMINILGSKYSRSPGYRSRLIFLNNGEIVHEESYLASVEGSSRFNIIIQSSQHYYRILTINEAKITAERSQDSYCLRFQ